MWNKIYTAVLGIFFVVSVILTYYSYTWLQSVAAPANVIQNYGYFANLGWLFLLISSLILLIISNIVLWTTRNVWAIWATFLYFAFFILLQTFWLGENFNRYKQQNGIVSSISFGTLFGVVLVGLAAIIAFFNQFLVKRMRDKMNAPPETESARPVDLDNNLD